MNLDPYLISHTKIKSKFINNLNVRAKTIKFLEENKVVNICDLGLSNLDMITAS